MKLLFFILFIFQSTFFQINDVTLSTCIFDVYAINKKHSDKTLSVLMTFGKVLVHNQEVTGDSTPNNMTLSKKSRHSGKQYYYLPFEENKELLWISRNVPYFKKRVYHSNILDNIAQNMVSRIPFYII